eukprot:6204498-Pleurochrysis_carterae.AAC.1
MACAAGDGSAGIPRRSVTLDAKCGTTGYFFFCLNLTKNTRQAAARSNARSTVLITIAAIAPGESPEESDGGGCCGGDGAEYGADGGKKMSTRPVVSAFGLFPKPNL